MHITILFLNIVELYALMSFTVLYRLSFNLCLMPRKYILGRVRPMFTRRSLSVLRRFSSSIIVNFMGNLLYGIFLCVCVAFMLPAGLRMFICIEVRVDSPSAGRLLVDFLDIFVLYFVGVLVCGQEVLPWKFSYFTCNYLRNSHTLYLCRNCSQVMMVEVPGAQANYWQALRKSDGIALVAYFCWVLGASCCQHTLGLKVFSVYLQIVSRNSYDYLFSMKFWLKAKF